MFCAAAWVPTVNNGSWEILFAALRKAFDPMNVTSARRTLDRCDAESMLVRSVAPLVREANARAKDLVIFRESEVRSSLDVIHSIVFDSNFNSSRHGRQKSVSPSDERLRLVVGRYEWNFIRLFGGFPFHRNTVDSTVSSL
jgi:hypothetical protein